MEQAEIAELMKEKEYLEKQIETLFTAAYRATPVGDSFIDVTTSTTTPTPTQRSPPPSTSGSPPPSPSSTSTPFNFEVKMRELQRLMHLYAEQCAQLERVENRNVKV